MKLMTHKQTVEHRARARMRELRGEPFVNPVGENKPIGDRIRDNDPVAVHSATCRARPYGRRLVQA